MYPVFKKVAIIYRAVTGTLEGMLQTAVMHHSLAINESINHFHLSLHAEG